MFLCTANRLWTSSSYLIKKLKPADQHIALTENVHSAVIEETVAALLTMESNQS